MSAISHRTVETNGIRLHVAEAGVERHSISNQPLIFCAMSLRRSARKSLKQYIGHGGA